MYCFCIASLFSETMFFTHCSRVLISRMKTKTKSELIASMAERFPHLLLRDVDFAVNGLLEAMGSAIAEGQRIEIRRFGSFTTHVRDARVGRNPRSGEAVFVPEKRVLHFKPGKELRYRVDAKVKQRLDIKTFKPL
jgi:integration host factor subunit beta